MGALERAPSAEEGAAIAAALERFMRDTSTRGTAPVHESDPWLRAGILEGIVGLGEADLREPWINT
jgi:hypothetical protein